QRQANAELFGQAWSGFERGDQGYAGDQCEPDQTLDAPQNVGCGCELSLAQCRPTKDCRRCQNSVHLPLSVGTMPSTERTQLAPSQAKTDSAKRLTSTHPCHRRRLFPHSPTPCSVQCSDELLRNGCVVGSSDVAAPRITPRPAFRPLHCAASLPALAWAQPTDLQGACRYGRCVDRSADHRDPDRHHHPVVAAHLQR